MTVIVGAGGHGVDIHAFTGWSLADENPAVGKPMPEPGSYVVGVNDPHVRCDMAARLEAEGWEPHRNGVLVWPGVHHGPDVRLGRHVHVNAGVFLTRCTVGEFTTVGPNATICGDVTIGARCQIGAGATVINLVSICDDVTVGAGAVVTKTITEPGTYVGVPARRVR